MLNHTNITRDVTVTAGNKTSLARMRAQLLESDSIAAAFFLCAHLTVPMHPRTCIGGAQHLLTQSATRRSRDVRRRHRRRPGVADVRK